MDDRRLSQLLAAVIVIVVLGVMWDVYRRTLRRAPAPAPRAVAADTVARPTAAPETASVPPVMQLPGTLQAGGRAAGNPLSGGGPSYGELLARAEARRQIRASAGLTYLNEIVAASGDSMLHRWDNRVRRPVRVHLAPGRAANFQPAFVDAFRSALRAWEEVVPIRFELTGDTAEAEVRVRWRVQFDVDRTGQTDLTWDENGHIQTGVVTIATFDPNGQPLGGEEIRLVALHELGHLIGLDHSSDSNDVMFPVATVTRLSRRDVETARLLYRLAPGSLR